MGCRRLWAAWQALRVGDEGGRRLRARGGLDVEVHGHLLEVGGGVIDAVLLGVEESGPYVGLGIEDLDVVERREPRHLGEQSERHRGHEELQGGGGGVVTASVGGLVEGP